MIKRYRNVEEFENKMNEGRVVLKENEFTRESFRFFHFFFFIGDSFLKW